MVNKPQVYFLVIISCWMLMADNVLADQHTSKKQDIKDAIEQVRTATTYGSRVEAAHRLANLTANVSRKDLDDKMIADIASLLEIRGRFIG